jgi:hypothetical protein
MMNSPWWVGLLVLGLIAQTNAQVTCDGGVCTDENGALVASVCFTYYPPDLIQTCEFATLIQDHSLTTTDSFLSGNQPVVSSTCDLTWIDDTVQDINCAFGGHTDRYWTASIGSYTETYVQTIEIFDDEDPLLHMPDDAVLDCLDWEMAFFYLDGVLPQDHPWPPGYATSTDNCDDAPFVQHTDTVGVAGCFPGGVIPGDASRIFIAIDNCGNTQQAIQDFEIVDTTDPVWIDVTFPADVSEECSFASIDHEAGMVGYDYNVVIANPTEYYIKLVAAAQELILANFNLAEADLIISYDLAYVGLTSEGNPSFLVQYALTTDEVTENALYDYVDSEEFHDELVALILADHGDVVVLDTQYLAYYPIPDNLPEVTDNCDQDGIDSGIQIVHLDISVEPSKKSAECVPWVERIWYATDQCGNQVSKTQTISNVDTGKPTVFAPADVIISCEDLGEYDVTAYGEPTWDDACALTDAAIVQVDGLDWLDATTYDDILEMGDPWIESSGGWCVLVVHRTYNISDDCGNWDTAEQLITLMDYTPPVFDYIPADASVSCLGQTDPDASGGHATGYDNCENIQDWDGHVTVHYLDSTWEVELSTTCTWLRQFMRFWIITDSCGLSSSAMQIVTTEDVDPPYITTAFPELSFECDEYFNALLDVAYWPTDYGDVCDDTINLPVTLTYEDNTVTCTDNSQCCTGDIGLFTVTLVEYTERNWIVMDNCGQFNFATTTYYSYDTVAPDLTIPADYTYNCETAYVDTTYSLAGFASAFDNCNTYTPWYEDTLLTNTCDDAWQISRAWYTQDLCREVVDFQNIYVVDDEIPAWTYLPSDKVYTCTDCFDPYDIACDFDVPTSIDNCDADPSIVYSDGTITYDETCTEILVLESDRYWTRTWITCDNCGNCNEYDQLIEIIDTTPPAIVPPPTASIECACPIDIFGLMDCSTSEWESDDRSELTNGVATATDSCAGTVHITYEDTSIFPDGGCDVAVRIVEYLAREWTAVDNCGNSVKTTQLINIYDTILPLLFIPEDVQVPCLETVDDLSILGEAVAEDECFDVVPTFVDEVIVGDCSDITQRTWFTFDACGNSATGTQLLEFFDEEPPVMTLPSEPVWINCHDDRTPLLASWFPTAVDACNSAFTFTYEDMAHHGTCFSHVTIDRTWTVTDVCDQSDSQIQVIEVYDYDDPFWIDTLDVFGQISFYGNPMNWPDVIRACEDLQSSVGVYDITALLMPDADNPYAEPYYPIVGDNCAGVNSAIYTGILWEDGSVATIASPPDPHVNFFDMVHLPVCNDEFQVLRSWLVADYCGNAIYSEQTIYVYDNIAPEVSVELPAYACPSDIESLEPITVVTDNCDANPIVNYDDVPIPGSTCASSIERTWVFEDDCGNANTFVEVITINDDSTPTWTFIVDDYSTACSYTHYDSLFSTGLFDSYELWPTETTGFMAADDDCADDVNANIAYVDAFNTLLSYDGAWSPFDDGHACLVNNQYVGFVYDRYWSTFDDCGNTVFHTQYLTYYDVTDPIISVDQTVFDLECDYTYLVSGEDFLTALIEAEFASATHQVTPSAFDECQIFPEFGVDIFVDSTFVDEVCDSDQLAYVIYRNWRTIDYCFHEVNLEQQINMFDTTPPVVVTFPADYTVTCDGSSSDVGTTGFPTFSDACDINIPAYTYFDETLDADCEEGNIGTIFRYFSQFDECGNEFTTKNEIDDSLSIPQTITFSGVGNPVFLEPYPLAGLGYSAVYDEQTQEIIGDALIVACDEVASIEAPLAAGVCFDEVPVTFIDDAFAGTCTHENVFVRAWYATDGCETAVVTQIIGTYDSVDPEWNTATAPDIDYPCTVDGLAPAGDVLVENGGTGYPTELSDNCDPAPSLLYTDAFDTTDCIREGVNRAWGLYDKCGQSVLYDQVITFTGNEVVSAWPADYSVTCTGSDPYSYIANPSDAEVESYFTIPDPNCATDINIIYYDDEATVTASCISAVIRNWEILCGANQDVVFSYLQKITVLDSEAPQWVGNAPDAIQPSVELATCSNPAPAPGSGTPEYFVTDSCDAEPELTYSDASFKCNSNFNDFVDSFRTWTASDACGNSITAIETIRQFLTSTQIIIEECEGDCCCDENSEAPVFSFVPADITTECDVSVEVTGMADASDNCDGTVVTYVDEVSTSVIVRTFTATNACDKTATATQTITIVDTTAPVITGATTATVDCADNTATTAIVVVDNCDASPDISFIDNVLSSGCVGSVQRMWLATDLSGNTNSIAQNLIVMDMNAPELSIPADIAISCNDATDISVTGAAVATDDCQEAELSFSDEEIAGKCDTERTLVRTFVATDGCGHTVSGSQMISVVDNAPVISVPDEASFSCSETEFGVATVLDDCDSGLVATYTDSVAQGTCATESVITRTWTVTDSCGNTASAVQTINIIDGVAPVISTEDVVVACDSTQVDTPTVTDCDDNVVITFTDSNVAGQCTGASVTTRTWTATDACGNSATATQVITIEDQKAPVIAIPADVVLQCDASADASNTGFATGTDSCDDEPTVTFVDTEVAGACPNSKVISRTWTVTDSCGSFTSAIQTITVVDSVAPALTLTQSVAVAMDNCDESVEVVSNDIVEDSTITRTFSATDSCGNVATISQVLIGDDLVVSGIDDVIVSCEESTDADFIGSPVVSTTCADADIPEVAKMDSATEGVCAAESVITRTWMITSTCGSLTKTQTIVVEDSIAPIITVPSDVTVNCDEDSTPTGTGVATAVDNCDESVNVSYEDVLAGDKCTGLFVTRTWTATDACGNSASAQQMITIIDSTAPTMAVGESMSVECSFDYSTVSAEAVDACDETPTLVSVDTIVPGSCSSTYTVVRTYTATDSCGNSVSDVQTIEVADSVAPVLNVPVVAETECGTEDFGVATAVDACDASPEVSFIDDVISEGCQSITERTWYAVDACGNMAQSVQTVSVVDSQAPAVVVPADITIACTQAATADVTGTATAVDACSDSPAVSFIDSAVAGVLCSEDATMTRTWNIEDDCGHTVNAVQTITFAAKSVGVVVVGVVDTEVSEDSQFDIVPVVAAAPSSTDFTVTVSCQEGLTIVNGASTHEMSGSLVAVNAALNALVFSAIDNFNGETSISVEAVDQSGYGYIAVFPITVVPVNDAPTVTATSVVAFTDSAIAFPVTVADIDGDDVTVTLVSELGQFAVDCVNFSPSWTGSSSVEDINAILAGTCYKGSTGIDNIHITVDDSSAVVESVVSIEVYASPAIVAPTSIEIASSSTVFLGLELVTPEVVADMTDASITISAETGSISIGTMGSSSTVTFGGAGVPISILAEQMTLVVYTPAAGASNDKITIDGYVLTDSISAEIDVTIESVGTISATETDGACSITLSGWESYESFVYFFVDDSAVDVDDKVVLSTTTDKTLIVNNLPAGDITVGVIATKGDVVAEQTTQITVPEIVDLTEFYQAALTMSSTEQVRAIDAIAITMNQADADDMDRAELLSTLVSIASDLDSVIVAQALELITRENIATNDVSVSLLESIVAGNSNVEPFVAVARNLLYAIEPAANVESLEIADSLKVRSYTVLENLMISIDDTVVEVNHLTVAVKSGDANVDFSLSTATAGYVSTLELTSDVDFRAIMHIANPNIENAVHNEPSQVISPSVAVQISVDVDQVRVSMPYDVEALADNVAPMCGVWEADKLTIDPSVVQTQPSSTEGVIECLFFSSEAVLSVAATVEPEAPTEQVEPVPVPESSDEGEDEQPTMSVDDASTVVTTESGSGSSSVSTTVILAVTIPVVVIVLAAVAFVLRKKKNTTSA